MNAAARVRPTAATLAGIAANIDSLNTLTPGDTISWLSPDGSTVVELHRHRHGSGEYLVEVWRRGVVGIERVHDLCQPFPADGELVARAYARSLAVAARDAQPAAA